MKQYNSANFATGGLGRLCKPSNLVPGVKLLNIGSFQFFSHMNSLNTPNSKLVHLDIKNLACFNWNLVQNLMNLVLIS